MCPVEATQATSRERSPPTVQRSKKRLVGEDVHAGIVALLDEHAFLGGLMNPYIRTKSLLLTLGIPTQQVRMWTINQHPSSLQYSAARIFDISVRKTERDALDSNQDKAISDELVVGMGFAELSGSRSETRQRYVGITTVFTGDWYVPARECVQGMCL